MSNSPRLPPKVSTGQRLITVGGNIDCCSVCLRLFGEDLDPHAVSALLVAKPTISCKKGDVTRGKLHDRIESNGKWLLTLDVQNAVTLEDLINRLLDQVSDDLVVWRELSSRYRADLFCGLQLKSLNRGLEMSPRTLQRIAERGLKFGLDIYYLGESDQPE